MAALAWRFTWAYKPHAQARTRIGTPASASPACGAAAWAGPPTWVHGDLHPACRIASGRRIIALTVFTKTT